MALNPLGAWVPESQFVFQDVNGTTPAKEFGDPLALVLDYFKSRMRGPNLSPGGFGDPSLSVESGLSISGDTLTLTPGTSRGVGAFVPVSSGVEVVFVTFRVDEVASTTLQVQACDNVSGTNAGDSTAMIVPPLGTFTVIIRLDSRAGFRLRFQRGPASSAELSNLTVQELPGNHLRQPTANARPTLEIELGNGRGPEQVTNGDFSDGANGWGGGGTGGMPTIANGVADFGPHTSGASFLRRTGESLAGGFSELTFIANQTGTLVIDLGAGSFTALSVVVGTNTLKGQAGTGDLIIRSNVAGDYAGTITNISVREVLRDGPRGLRFDGVDDFLDATGLTAATGPKTVIAGCVTDDGSANQFLFDVETGRSLYAAVRNAANSAGLFDGSWSSDGAYASTSLSVLTFKHYAADGGIRHDGAPLVTENFIEHEYSGGVTVGGNFSGVANFLEGKVYVLLVFDRALTAFEIWLCENWIARKMEKSL